MGLPRKHSSARAAQNRRLFSGGPVGPLGMGDAAAGSRNRVEVVARYFASSVRNPQWRAALNYDAWDRG